MRLSRNISINATGDFVVVTPQSELNVTSTETKNYYYSTDYGVNWALKINDISSIPAGFNQFSTNINYNATPTTFHMTIPTQNNRVLTTKDSAATWTENLKFGSATINSISVSGTGDQVLFTTQQGYIYELANKQVIPFDTTGLNLPNNLTWLTRNSINTKLYLVGNFLDLYEYDLTTSPSSWVKKFTLPVAATSGVCIDAAGSLLSVASNGGNLIVTQNISGDYIQKTNLSGAFRSTFVSLDGSFVISIGTSVKYSVDAGTSFATAISYLRH